MRYILHILLLCMLLVINSEVANAFIQNNTSQYDFSKPAPPAIDGFNLQPEVGWLSVQTITSGVTIEIDGMIAAKTPIKDMMLSIGSHSIK